jgi:hypothetical protein
MHLELEQKINERYRTWITKAGPSNHRRRSLVAPPNTPLRTASRQSIFTPSATHPRRRMSEGNYRRRDERERRAGTSELDMVENGHHSPLGATQTTARSGALQQEEPARFSTRSPDMFNLTLDDASDEHESFRESPCPSTFGTYLELTNSNG